MRALIKRLAAVVLTIMAAGWFASGSAGAETIRLVAFGDSLTAGYGLAANDAYPARLEARLRADGHDVRIDNAGASGDTASAAARRLDWSVPEGTDGVIVALGGNDLLRGIDPAVTRSALTRIIDRLAERGIPVLLAGMRAPVNLGTDYATAFEAIFTDLGNRPGVVYQPFFLDGVAAVAALNQPDGIHPTADGVAVIVDNIAPYAAALLTRIAAPD